MVRVSTSQKHCLASLYVARFQACAGRICRLESCDQPLAMMGCLRPVRCRVPKPPKGQGELLNKKLEAGTLQNELQQMATHAAMASQMCAAMDLANPRAGWANLGTLLHALSNSTSAGGRPELYQLLEVCSSPLLCFLYAWAGSVPYGIGLLQSNVYHQSRMLRVTGEELKLCCW